MLLLYFIVQFNSNHANSVSFFELLNTACPTSGEKSQLEAGESFSSDSEVVAPSSHNEITGTDEILRQFCQLFEKNGLYGQKGATDEGSTQKG